MEKLSLEQIRSTFIDYFKGQDHTHVPSSSLVPHNDPTLMFVNSGMVQFKDVFTGVETRNYKRATSSQKSVRAGGKHNDLDNVGYTARHHTFFEMLGNFSFGDYFKEEAITYAWDLLTNHFCLPKEKLYLTVYHNDDEAANWWKKITGFSDDKIIRIPTNDNFWSMGDTGPCGPCTEIFYDHGDKIWGGLPGTKDADGDRYIEIWNLVFMQFEQINKDTRIELPKKSVDTGMGLERIAAVIQGVHDNYDVDVFKELIGYTESILKVKATGEEMFSYRVIADHLRSCSFLIADGVMPSNEGRGYVLRRIMRRAMRHAHQLGAKEPLMYKLLPKLVDLFGHAYPELKRAEDFVSSILKQEEERFKVTLDRGLKLLEEESANLGKGSKLPGEVAFKLYDTYGFPLDLTEDILKKQSANVDLDGFNKCMEEQRERARKSWVGSGESKTDRIWFDTLAKHGATEFLGYSHDTIEGSVLTLVQNSSAIGEINQKGTEFFLIANQTPFYAESGGQMGDVGVISSNNCKVTVKDTLKFAGKIHAHKCVLDDGVIKTGDSMKFSIDREHRNNLRMHHSATHILHAVLREVLGKHITQKGSLVAVDRLRFDISHPKALTAAEIALVEEKVNNIIAHNSKVNTNLMSLEKATESGAMALFGEKYDSEVRVVSMGPDIENSSYSFELCGGTHVKRTGDIGVFKIISESAIAAGVRRIEAVCGPYAFGVIKDQEDKLNKVIDLLKSNKQEVVLRLEVVLQEKKDLEKQVAKLQMDKLILSKDDLVKLAKDINGVKLVYQYAKDLDSKAMRAAAEDLVKNNPGLVIIYATSNQEKISMVIGCSKDISGKFNAGEIAKKVSNIIDGSGGGSQTLAQIGGSNMSRLAKLEEDIINLL